MGKGIVRAAGIAIGALACAHVSPSGMAPPLQCRARGLWTLERHGASDVRDAWVILAMAPWDSWQTGFQLSDGQGGSLLLRVSGVFGEQVSLTARQAAMDREPTIFTRGSVGCAFYSRDEAESYRFRRER